MSRIHIATRTVCMCRNEEIITLQKRKLSAHLWMKYSLGISKISLAFPILMFSSISLHWSLKKAFFSLLIILWHSALRWVYLSFSPLVFTSLFLSASSKASSYNHFAFFSFLFLGDGFDHNLLYSVMNCCPQFFRLSIRSNPLNYLSLSLYNHQGFDLGHTWMA